VFISFIQRFNFSAADFSNLGSIPDYLPGGRPKAPALGQWSEYSNLVSETAVAWQNGKLVKAKSGYIDGQWTPIASGASIFNFGVAGRPDIHTGPLGTGNPERCS
jgi:hypothetical protein